jgi:phosphoserine phosphatase RsbU/P
VAISRTASRSAVATRWRRWNSRSTPWLNRWPSSLRSRRRSSDWKANSPLTTKFRSCSSPHKFTGLTSLEVYGVCPPARSVSGDYYDFIPLGTDRLVLAVGDISGKGISAALLMATVHAFVRAYSLEPNMVLTPVALGVRAFSNSDPRMYYRGDGITQSQLAPGMLMTTLNYQLFRSTPPEKYATMFLGCYDATVRELCNAGHLPPIMLRANGGISRLETSGSVVGPFDGTTYDESRIAMQPGDIFVAFSDGVTEPENESGEFGEERLIDPDPGVSPPVALPHR